MPTVDRVVAFVSGYYSKPDVIRNTIMAAEPPDVVVVVGPPPALNFMLEALEWPGRPNIVLHEDTSTVPHHPNDRLLVFINPGAPDGLRWWHAAAEWCREKATGHLETA